MGGEVRIKMSWVEENRKVNNWNGRFKRKFKSSGIGTYLSRWVGFQRFAPGSNK